MALVDPLEAISIARQAELLDISRASVYAKPIISCADTEMMEAMDRIYTDLPFYGSRRMVTELFDRFGLAVGRHRVRRLMAIMGLETTYPKPKTSVAHPLHATYPYLLRNVVASYPNHIWGTDITYIPLRGGFCYLVALLDWYSRYVVHWELSPTLEIPFCLDNITRALETGIPDIHNSDQGSHFTSPRYVDILKEKKVSISMDGRGRCMDNIFTERLWRTVKYEDVYLRGYSTFLEVTAGLTDYFRFYNEKRRHSSLQNRIPKDVYQNDTKSLREKRESLSTLPV